MARLPILSRLWALRQVKFTRLERFALALVVIGLATTLALPGMLLLRQWRVETFMEVQATVKALEERCNLLGKTVSGKFELVKTTACAEADVFLASNAADDWKVTREGVVTLDYVASGLSQSVTLPTTRFDADSLKVGASVPLHVNPNRLEDVETETTWHNFIMTLVFTLIGAGMAVVGWLLFRWLRSGGTAEDSLQTIDPAAASDDDDIFEPRRPMQERR